MVMLRALALLFSMACAAYFSTPRAVAIFIPVPVLWVLWSWYLDKRPGTRSEFPFSAVIVLVIWFAPMVVWYVHLGMHASPEPWGFFDTSVSPVGRSPCCNQVKGDKNPCLTVPYHPAGYFSYGRDAPNATNSANLLFCPVGRWADSNDLKPVGHNKGTGGLGVGPACVAGRPCDFIASTDKIDYPDLAKGLKDGWFNEAVVSPIALCPGVGRTVNSQGFVGRGQEICAQCAFPKPAHCRDASQSQWFCFMCPGGHFGSEPLPQPFEDVRFTAELLFGQFLFLLLCTCASVPRCGRKTYPKGYNPLF